jgi:hypothetical protein
VDGIPAVTVVGKAVKVHWGLAISGLMPPINPLELLNVPELISPSAVVERNPKLA